MRAVAQRVREARITVEGEEVGAMGAGLLALVGVARGEKKMTLRMIAQFAAVILTVASSGSAFTGDFEDGGEIVEELIEHNL